MDPTLKAALQKLQLAMTKAKAAGVTLDPQAIDAFLKEETGGKHGLEDVSRINLRNLGRSAVQGATMNYGDETLQALPILSQIPQTSPVASALQMLFGGGPAAADEMRAGDALFKKQHPVADIGAGIAGAVAPALLAPEMLPASGGAVGAILKGAGAGAAAGAVSASGAAEDGHRLGAAGEGAVVGGFLGGAIPAVAAPLRLAASPIARAARRFAHAGSEDGGPNALEEMLNRYVDAGRGSIVTAADLGPRLLQEADFAANNSDDVLVKMAQLARDRNKGQAGRLLDDVKGAVGDPHAPSIQEGLEASRREFAAGPDGYGGLRAANPEVNAMNVGQDLGAILEQPKIKSAWAAAQETGLVGKYPDKGQPSFQMIQDLKESLDDAASEAFRKGRGNLGSRLASARDEVTKFLETNIPNYAEVSQEYARRLGVERALKRGTELFHEADVPALQKYVASLAPEELTAVRQGLASEYVQQLRSVAKNKDVAKRLTDMSDAEQAKLEVMFGDKGTFDNFMAVAKLEAELHKLANVVGGSQTARRLSASGFDPAELGAHALVTGPEHALLSAIAKHTTGALARRTAAAEGPMLMTQGEDAIRALLQQMRAQPFATLPNRAAVMPGVMASSLLGN